MTHSPKVAALIAYDSGLLTDAGRARVERHIAACDACRQTLVSIRAYESLVDDVRGLPAPEPDWSRMELSLRREARLAARAGRSSLSPWTLAAVAVAAAAVVALALLPRSDTEPTARPAPATPEGPSAPAAEQRAALRAEVTLATEGVTDGARALEVGSLLDEGAVVHVAAGAVAHLAFYEGTGVVLPGGSRARLAGLRHGQIRIGLEAGSVHSEVATLGEGDLYDVSAGRFTVRVRGTRFVVTIEGEGVAVSVDEGVVEVTEGDRVVSTVRAPGQWSSEPGAERASVQRPHGLSGAARSWPVLRLPPMASLTEWQIDELRVGAAGRMSLRLPPGEVTVAGFTDGTEMFRVVSTIGPEGLSVTPAELRPSAPPERQGQLDAALIMPVLAAGMPRLRSCQERLARLGPSVIGRYTLRMTIGLTGDVIRARLLSEGEPPPPAFTECILTEARRLVFPPPTGGTVDIAQPLQFRTRR